jgi:superfamily II DNA or RNA helicase
MKFKAGSLVRVRERDWVVLPSPRKDLVILKPLGGSEDEITGIFIPLSFESDEITSTRFRLPDPEDIGDISSARVLYNACRLSFRNGAGPFRSLAKLSFRPRSYQMVPLIMALRQSEPVRLLIADDVGVGKTVEALMILKEFLERREIRRFAIIVPPHLCEQWRAELWDKFSIDAVIIRSNTQAKLDREIHDDTSIYEYYPCQIISIDYIKSDVRRQVFVQQCPEFVIVDEAHTCTNAHGATHNQQQRYRLIHDIAAKPGQSMVYLTATPHSGKPEQFQALLGLIKPEFYQLDLTAATQSQRRNLARYYVQRRRADVEKWMNEDTPFPERDAGELQYDLSKEYAVLYQNVFTFAFGITKHIERTGARRLRYWSALALLRGIMSSPAAGLEMLQNRIISKKNTINYQPGDESETSPNLFESVREDTIPDQDNPLLDEDFTFAEDFTPSAIIEKTRWTSHETKTLSRLFDDVKKLQTLQYDRKAAQALKIVETWLVQGFHPVIFCRYIATAKYFGTVLKKEIGNRPDVDIQIITSEDPDEVRKERILMMADTPKRILVATDCLSEGINLQDLFSAVLHYDLPWNPNRLEQREGRVDRFGQTAPLVKAFLFYGNNNPIDGVVLKVLLRKIREIRKSTGISIPFPEDSRTLMDSILQAVLETPRLKSPTAIQLSLFDEHDLVKSTELSASRAIEEAAQREKASRTIFAQNAIKAREIEQDLLESDEAIGTPEAVKQFVIQSLENILGAQITWDGRYGYRLFQDNIPDRLKGLLPRENPLLVSFDSPTPEGYRYIGRNHPFVEQLCQFLMANSLSKRHTYGPARSAIVRSKDITCKTTLLLFRVRNVIEAKQTREQLVAEEMLTWGYRFDHQDHVPLTPETTQFLLHQAVPSSDLSSQAKKEFLDNELQEIKRLYVSGTFDRLALDRAKILLEAHERFRKVLGGSQYKVVEPVLPMDLMGIYILLPERTGG